MLKRIRGSILQSGREISRQELDEIQETVGVFPRLSRTELAATICEHLGWMTASGGYKIDACMKLLEKLESKGFVELPEKRQRLCGMNTYRVTTIWDTRSRSVTFYGILLYLNEVCWDA